MEEDLLYHYCSYETFFNIMRNTSIWLTSIEKTNDGEELKYFLKNFVEAGVRKLCIDRNIMITDDLMDSIYQHPNKKFIFCMSTEGDLLSQWRGYSDNAQGVSIGFSKQELFGLQNNSHGTILTDVQYGNFDCLHKNVSDGIEEFVRFIDTDHQRHARCMFIECAPWFKHRGFEEEKEWRLIFDPTYKHYLQYENNEDEYTMKDLNYHMVSGKMRGYHELSFFKNKSLIKRVILGSKCKETTQDVEDVLVHFGYKIGENGVEIQRSDIPYI